MPATGERTDPFLGLHFFVELGNIQIAGFRECSGLDVTTEVFEYKEGGLNDVTHKLPGRTSFANIVLRHGLTDSDDLWDWYLGVVRGQIERRDISIVLYDSTGQEMKRWSFQGAYPMKWSGPTFAADKAAVTIETLELAHQGLTPS